MMGRAQLRDTLCYIYWRCIYWRWVELRGSEIEFGFIEYLEIYLPLLCLLASIIQKI